MATSVRTKGLDAENRKRHSRRPQEKQAVVADGQDRVKVQRDAAIIAAFGLLKGKDVLPLDALQFEREMRDE